MLARKSSYDSCVCELYLYFFLAQIYQFHKIEPLFFVGLGILLVRGLQHGMVAWTKVIVS